MREIKFRGKRIDNGEWVFGDYSRYSKDQSIIMVDLLEQEDYWVASETVGQYTGLKDKNGVEIYEGDVIQEFAGEHAQGVWQYSNVSIVEDLRWLPDSLDFADCAYVIGNIHDNPELMTIGIRNLDEIIVEIGSAIGKNYQTTAERVDKREKM